MQMYYFWLSCIIIMDYILYKESWIKIIESSCRWVLWYFITKYYIPGWLINNCVGSQTIVGLNLSCFGSLYRRSCFPDHNIYCRELQRARSRNIYRHGISNRCPDYLNGYVDILGTYKGKISNGSREKSKKTNLGLNPPLDSIHLDQLFSCFHEKNVFFFKWP